MQTQTQQPQARAERLDRTIEAQRNFLGRVPDPDTRERAEGHLLQLVEMRAELARGMSSGL